MQQQVRVLAGVMIACSLVTCLLAVPATLSRQKRSFYDLQCKGVYDKSIFARLDLICDDCYNLFREPQLHQLCRKDCFTSDYFKGCIEALLLKDESGEILEMVETLGR
ncbi:ion transport peptide-like isoform X2 [Macrosteles quadrilineatus]|uniref:ion transport peptide-like isoform X2 n=1 Tax=Macrosteles quadrilineatus TaxID=74068 RepID=UPI0023E32795|nr:ion transport peptide-like isoform X2 [Macrosteles quadrilineatus]